MARFFRRYKSTIYGNYRKAYCVDGVLIGVCMSALMAIRDLIASKPMASPENYVTEIILAVGILWSTYQYRKQLPEGKVTFKELMLLGLGIGVVSAVVYGLWVWLNCGVLSPERVQYYNEQRMAVMDAPEQSAEAAIAIEKVKAYTAGDWAFIGGFRSAVMSIIIAFFAALIFRTEKGTVVTMEQKTENSKQTQK